MTGEHRQGGDMSPEEQDDDAAKYKPAADDTMFIPTVADDIEPPTRTREVLHSWPFFLVVVGSPALGLWILCWHLSWNPVIMALAITFSVLAGLSYALRFLRGSLLDVEERQWYERQEYYRTIELNPESEFIRTSNRLGKRLQRNERPIWEFRPHPMDLFMRWFRGIFRTKIGLFSLGTYAIASALAYYGMLPRVTFLALGAGLALYLGCVALSWQSTPYLLTSHRFMAVHGVVKKDFGAIPRISMMDQNDNTTVPGEILAWLRWIESPYSRLEFETPGSRSGNLPEIVGYVANGPHNITKYSPRRS